MYHDTYFHMSIFDNSLALVKQVRAQYGAANLDQHETHLSRNAKAAHVISYNPERYDLSAQNISTGQGWIHNPIFQRINIESGDLVFQWSPIEHVALSESFVLPDTTEVVGTGFNSTSPWDYFHMNAIDEHPDDGHYLVSARHVSAVYKVNGETGEIMWRLGGSMSDFEFEPGLKFSSQHDARWRASNASTDIISLFDNASNGFQRTADRSQGMILKLDHSTDPPRVTLLKSFPSPDDAQLSNSQGNLQLLTPDDWANSHAFIGWGSNPYMTEHDASGRIIFQANVEASDSNTSPMHYRAYKFNFTSEPRDAPALYTYSRTDSDNTVYYMSWNGATEVRQWRIYSRSKCNGAWTVLATVEKTGFETRYEAQGYQQFGLVEAIDRSGRRLRNSTARGVRTFVPAPFLAQSCDADGCQATEEYVTPEQTVNVAETRMGCAAPAGAVGVNQGSGDSQSGGGSASTSDSGRNGGDENGAYRFVSSFGLAEMWMWMVLAFVAWSAVV